MGIEDNMLDPGAELDRISGSIKRYELIARSTIDPVQKKRVAKILGELRDYRERIKLLFQVEKGEEFDSSSPSGDGDQKRFSALLPQKDGGGTRAYSEIRLLSRYMDFFYDEFLSFFSERKLKLDFKYSIDRDSTHNKFSEIKRRVADFENELTRLSDGLVQRELEPEIRRRNSKLSRSLVIEADKFFSIVRDFAADLAHDAESDGLLCMNGSDLISFELSVENRYCEGLTVLQALGELIRFCDEVIEFLNIPEIEA